jgi:hypothetical protein
LSIATSHEWCETAGLLSSEGIKCSGLRDCECRMTHELHSRRKKLYCFDYSIPFKMGVIPSPLKGKILTGIRGKAIIPPGKKTELEEQFSGFGQCRRREQELPRRKVGSNLENLGAKSKKLQQISPELATSSLLPSEKAMVWNRTARVGTRPALRSGDYRSSTAMSVVPER